MLPKELLKTHVNKIASLTESEFDYFYSFFKPKSYKKGQAIVSEGDIVDCEYFVTGGCLKSFFLNDDIKMFILQFSMPTWWTSDYNALQDGTRASISIDCITDADVICLSKNDRERLCGEIHQLEHFFRLRTQRGYAALQKRLLSLMHKDAKNRYEELMTQYPQLYNIVPKHLIAAYLGVSRETLSRLYHP
jgi:CRP-like cAMP-binding protein